VVLRVWYPSGEPLVTHTSFEKQIKRICKARRALRTVEERKTSHNEQTTRQLLSQSELEVPSAAR
jgi:hypothetical protein